MISRATLGASMTWQTPANDESERSTTTGLLCSIVESPGRPKTDQSRSIMNPVRRTAMIERLARGIERIGPRFEVFAGIVMAALAKVPTTHDGVNALGYPVAKVADGESDDGSTVFEYSDEAGYFVAKMPKPEQDLRKVLKDKPNATTIYLVSGSKRKPQKIATFRKTVEAWPGMKGKVLHIWASQDIAAHLVDHLLVNDRLVRRLAPYLPELQRLADEEAATRLAPAPDANRVPRTDVDQEIARRLKAFPVVAIAGMAGLGKSNAAAAFAANHAEDYDLVVWLEGEEVDRIESLLSVPLTRVGEQRNIVTLLKHQACLLVVDNVQGQLAAVDIAKLCGPKSHVILTQRRSVGETYDLPLLDEVEARAVLNRAGTPVPDPVFDTIWAKVGGHPFSLNLLQAAVAEEGATWSEVQADCVELGEMADDRGQRLADRMLKHLAGVLTRELAVFEWAGLPAIGEEFLLQTILPLGVRKLRSFGLTAVDRSGVLRLHDVVFAVLDGRGWADASRCAELDDRLEAYLIATAEELGLTFWATARSLRPKLEALVAAGDRRSAFLYALLVVWEPSEVRPDLVGDPVATAQALAEAARGPLGVIAVIEAIEQLFLLEKELEGDVARKGLQARLPAFDTMLALGDLSDRERAQLQHHKGKALKRLGDTAAAAALFDTVLAGPYPMNESRLQLIDIRRSDPTQTAATVQHVDAIFADLRNGGEVTYSVLLGLIERLPAGKGAWRNTVIAQHLDEITKTIVQAAKLGVSQAFRAFAPLGRFMSSEMPDEFRAIFDQLPAPGLESLGVDGDRFAWAEIYAEAARLPGAASVQLRSKALALYEGLVKPQKFHTQRRAELLIDMGRPADGEALIRTLPDIEGDDGWLQRLMARARLAQGDPDDALRWIDLALDKLKAANFKSEFLELRFAIRDRLGDSQAYEDLIAARAASEKTGEQLRLDQRLADLGRR